MLSTIYFNHTHITKPVKDRQNTITVFLLVVFTMFVSVVVFR